MRCWQINSNDGIDALECVDRPSPIPGAGQVLMRVRAVSVNYRDYSTVLDPAARNLPLPRIPNSDAAGEILAVGDGVDGVAVGDRVTSCFFQNWVDGPCSTIAMNSALGGALEGVLAEEVVLSANGVIPIPDHLDFMQAATLPCAALTAWHALVEVARIKPGQSVLLLGTGGVSVFALQFAGLLGARVIMTSSSDDKLAQAGQIGDAHFINYRKTPEWQKAVLDLTGGEGVDTVVEVGGAGTLQKSIEAVRVGGSIALIGVLTGGEINPTAIMRKSVRVQGVYVGSRRMFEDMNQALAAHRVEPVIHQAFSFDHARDAFKLMGSAAHFGKIVISI